MMDTTNPTSYWIYAGLSGGFQSPVPQMAGSQGFEPQTSESESDALPLRQLPIKQGTNKPKLLKIHFILLSLEIAECAFMIIKI